MLWNGSKQDGNVRREREEYDNTDHEDGDSDTEWSRQMESDMICVLSVCN